MTRKRRLLAFLIALLLIVLVAMPVLTWGNLGNTLGNVAATFDGGLFGSPVAATQSFGTPFVTPNSTQLVTIIPSS